MPDQKSESKDFLAKNTMILSETDHDFSKKAQYILMQTKDET